MVVTLYQNLILNSYPFLQVTLTGVFQVKANFGLKIVRRLLNWFGTGMNRTGMTNDWTPLILNLLKLCSMALTWCSTTRILVKSLYACNFNSQLMI